MDKDKEKFWEANSEKLIAVAKQIHWYDYDCALSKSEIEELFVKSNKSQALFLLDFHSIEELNDLIDQ